MGYRPTSNYRESLSLNEIPNAQAPSASNPSGQDGVMSAADKAKLDGLSPSADARSGALVVRVDSPDNYTGAQGATAAAVAAVGPPPIYIAAGGESLKIESLISGAGLLGVNTTFVLAVGPSDVSSPPVDSAATVTAPNSGVGANTGGTGTVTLAAGDGVWIHRTSAENNAAFYLFFISVTVS